MVMARLQTTVSLWIALSASFAASQCVVALFPSIWSATGDTSLRKRLSIPSSNCTCLSSLVKSPNTMIALDGAFTFDDQMLLVGWVLSERLAFESDTACTYGSPLLLMPAERNV